MNQMITKRTFFDRIRDAIKAFQGKPIGSVTYGIELKKCAECEQPMKTALYECDRECCGDECPNPFCHLTRDISHAINFEPIECMNGVTFYQEIPRGPVHKPVMEVTNESTE